MNNRDLFDTENTGNLSIEDTIDIDSIESLEEFREIMNLLDNDGDNADNELKQVNIDGDKEV